MLAFVARLSCLCMFFLWRPHFGITFIPLILIEQRELQEGEWKWNGNGMGIYGSRPRRMKGGGLFLLWSCQGNRKNYFRGEIGIFPSCFFLSLLTAGKEFGCPFVCLSPFFHGHCANSGGIEIMRPLFNNTFFVITNDMRTSTKRKWKPNAESTTHSLNIKLKGLIPLPAMRPT